MYGATAAIQVAILMPSLRLTWHWIVRIVGDAAVDERDYLLSGDAAAKQSLVSVRRVGLVPVVAVAAAAGHYHRPVVRSAALDGSLSRRQSVEKIARPTC